MWIWTESGAIVCEIEHMLLGFRKSGERWVRVGFVSLKEVDRLIDRGVVGHIGKEAYIYVP